MTDIRSRVSEAEWQARTDLAAVFRLAARHDLSDLALTHFAARVPDEPDRFLLNPYGLMFEEITASSLVKTDRDGNDPLESGSPLNAVGIMLHSAVLDARPDVACTAHTHTAPGMALASLDTGLLPISQTAMAFHGRVGYHDWESGETEMDERERLARDIGPNGRALVLKNHGLLAAGPSISMTWVLLYELERACASQMDAMAAVRAAGTELDIPSASVCERTAAQFDEFLAAPARDNDWPAYLDMLDREDPSYRE